MTQVYSRRQSSVANLTESQQAAQRVDNKHAFTLCVVFEASLNDGQHPGSSGTSFLTVLTVISTVVVSFQLD